MGLLRKNRKVIKIESDLSACNHLPTELKVKIARAQLLMDETSERMRYLGNEVSLPYKLQLKGDILEIEKLIDAFAENRAKKNALETFDNTVLRFQTEAENILNFKFDK